MTHFKNTINNINGRTHYPFIYNTPVIHSAVFLVFGLSHHKFVYERQIIICTTQNQHFDVCLKKRKTNHNRHYNYGNQTNLVRQKTEYKPSGKIRPG